MDFEYWEYMRFCSMWANIFGEWITPIPASVSLEGRIFLGGEPKKHCILSRWHSISLGDELLLFQSLVSTAGDFLWALAVNFINPNYDPWLMACPIYLDFGRILSYFYPFIHRHPFPCTESIDITQSYSSPPPQPHHLTILINTLLVITVL